MWTSVVSTSEEQAEQGHDEVTGVEVQPTWGLVTTRRPDVFLSVGGTEGFVKRGGCSQRSPDNERRGGYGKKENPPLF